jgi:hypothetical protein
MISALLRFVALVLIASNMYGQSMKLTSGQDSASSVCGYVADHESISYRREILARMYSEDGLTNRFRFSSNKYKIPVVVHVIEPSKYSSAMSDDAIREGIDNLNKVYRGGSGYESSPDIGIEFELAKYDPNCNPTSGITRYDASGSETYVNEGLDYKSMTELGNWIIWDRQSYLNIWIVHKFKNNEAAGVANSSVGAVVKNTFFFVGAVTAHEVGHYFGLNHPFPETTTLECNCGDGDGLKDTPDLTTFGLGSLCDHQSNCEPADLTKINPCTGSPFGLIQKNIMNYSCHEVFTDDQRSMMRAFLESAHGSLLQSPALNSKPPEPVATLSGAPIIYLGRHGVVNAGVRASCACNGQIKKLTINENEVQPDDISTVPILPFGGSTVWKYDLTCSNGAITNQEFRFQRVGVTNIQRMCTSGNTYLVTFDNPDNFAISASNGTIAGNSITNIPSSQDVVLRVTTTSGYSDSITVDIPCCADGRIANTKCLPKSENSLSSNLGIDNFTFGQSINKSSASASEDGTYYTDLSCSEQARVEPDGTYFVSIKAHSDSKHFVKVFIDYNDDGDFNVENELALSGTTSGNAENLFTGNIQIAAAAVGGKKLRLRVLADVSANSNACIIYGSSGGEISGTGQIEDYSLFVNQKEPVKSIMLTADQIKTIQQKWREVERKKLHTVKFPGNVNTQNFKTSALPDIDLNVEKIQVAGSASLYVFPNPIKGNQFTLALPNPDLYEITLYSESGRLVPVDLAETELNDQLLITFKSKPSSGLYLLKIIHKINFQEKLIKIIIL